MLCTGFSLHFLIQIFIYSILVSDRNVLKICDFGLSRLWETQRSTVLSFCGTPAWMAPEIIRREKCSEKVSEKFFVIRITTQLY